MKFDWEYLNNKSDLIRKMFNKKRRVATETSVNHVLDVNALRTFLYEMF